MPGSFSAHLMFFFPLCSFLSPGMQYFGTLQSSVSLLRASSWEKKNFCLDEVLAVMIVAAWRHCQIFCFSSFILWRVSFFIFLYFINNSIITFPNKYLRQPPRIVFFFFCDILTSCASGKCVGGKSVFPAHLNKDGWLFERGRNFQKGNF